MIDDIWLTLDRLYVELPALKAERGASAVEIAAAEELLSYSFPSAYRDFLARYGAAIVGPFPIFGLLPVPMMGRDHWSVVEVTQRSRDQDISEIAEWIVVSEDHAGNPVGFDQQGQIWIYDHDFGGKQMMSKDFESYLRYCIACTESEM